MSTSNNIASLASSLQTSPFVKNDTGDLGKENTKLPEELAANDPKLLTTNEDLRESLRKTNIRYIFDQINRAMQNHTREMIRQAQERQREDGE